ncbi:hypothetical protein K435DRAFT_963307 [Dendrothele bispora CBS 962.96]|uniref:AB hydrolase-1 domain-containing protein n=1 Tax=Dendrothele bispora (strain CBS 962.96) TaxID=1314807 RepID=A0A4S8MH84_DENBC|nr:hypothetical protein K435DRAFT_963307 [Dendrothele bispora CBS 962.96]
MVSSLSFKVSLTTLALGLSTFVSNAIAQTTFSQFNCTEFFVPVDISAQTVKLNLGNPHNQSELSGLVTRMTYLNSTIVDEVTVGPSMVNATFNIWSELCVPGGFKEDGIIEFTIHGSTENHTYFNFGKESPFNYAEAALKAGHAIFTYDGLGAGKSDKPDGIQDVQIGTETAVAIALVEKLPSLLSFGKVIGVGHAHGSVIMIGMLAERGDLFNATVLTSIAPVLFGVTEGLAAMDVKIAAEVVPERYHGLESSYAVSGGLTNDQITFYHFPFFDPEVFLEMQSGRELITLGVLLTLPQNGQALNYTNPLLVVTGDRDYFMCGGNCNVTDGDFPSRPAAVAGLFPAVNDFTVHIPENTGHFVNYHFSAPQTFTFIQQWIGGRV